MRTAKRGLRHPASQQQVLIMDYKFIDISVAMDADLISDLAMIQQQIEYLNRE